MSHNVQQQDIDLLFQKSKDIYVKIQLLNKDFLVIDELCGETISGDISIDSQSDIRRSLNLELLVKNNSLLTNEGGKIWIDKFVRIYMGLYHLRTQKIVYYPLGVFLFNDNTFTYNSTTQTLSVNCLDLMSLMTGTRRGQVSGLTASIPEGNNIREVMISFVSQLAGFKKYLIEDIGKTIPYDLSFSTGVTIYEMISKVRDLYPAWETFFDIDGTFIYQAIPSCKDNNIVFDKETMRKLTISESLTNSFSEVKNKTEIWGKSISADRFVDSSTNTGSQYNITLTNFELKNGVKVAFKTNVANLTNPSLKINSLSAYGIYNEKEQLIPAGTMKINTSYALRYRNSKFYLLGQFQITATAMDTNPDSPFYVGDNQENVVLQVLSGGDFEKIYSDELCQERADYENWKSTRLTDSISLEMMLIPWLDVNQKVEYTSFVTGETSQYITKKISFNLQSGTMNVETVKFYPLYPNILSKE